MAKTLTIGICGGTGSGKTTITNRLTEALSEDSVLLLQQDHYYKDTPHLPLEDRAKQNFDHPESVDTQLLISHVRALREGQAIESARFTISRSIAACRQPFTWNRVPL